jgi:hypothetical protein
MPDNITIRYNFFKRICKLYFLTEFENHFSRKSISEQWCGYIVIFHPQWWWVNRSEMFYNKSAVITRNICTLRTKSLALSEFLLALYRWNSTKIENFGRTLSISCDWLAASCRLIASISIHPSRTNAISHWRPCICPPPHWCSLDSAICRPRVAVISAHVDRRGCLTHPPHARRESLCCCWASARIEAELIRRFRTVNIFIRRYLFSGGEKQAKFSISKTATKIHYAIATYVAIMINRDINFSKRWTSWGIAVYRPTPLEQRKRPRRTFVTIFQR